MQLFDLAPRAKIETRKLFALCALAPQVRPRPGVLGEVANLEVIRIGGVIQREQISKAVVNFYTEGSVRGLELTADGKALIFELLNALMEGGATINIISLKGAREMDLKLFEDRQLGIKMANGMVTPIGNVMRFTIRIAGQDYEIHAFVIGADTSYSVLLGRLWLRKAIGITNLTTTTSKTMGDLDKLTPSPQEIPPAGIC